jgi:hypothetical protein
MKWKLGVIVVVLSWFAVIPAQAESDYDMFKPCTWSIDALGFFASRDKGGSSDNALGPGVGLNYFFTENWGAGVDTYADAFEVPYLLNVSGIYRYPIRNRRFAPYGFAGVGRQWEHAAQWMGHLGAGVEYSLQRRTSVFADLRGVFPDRTKDYAVLRFGFRFELR